MNEETWKPIPGYKNYEVSNLGRIRSYRKANKGIPKILQGSTTKQGYKSIGLPGKTLTIHRLVMLAFVGPCPEGLEVCHNDGNKLNNTTDNLRYDTRTSNLLDTIKHNGGVHPNKKVMKSVSERRVYSKHKNSINIYEFARFIFQPSITKSMIVDFITSKLSPLQLSTYILVRENLNCQSSLVSESLKITIFQVNNLLRQLMRLKLVDRVKSGGVYRYRVVEV